MPQKHDIGYSKRRLAARRILDGEIPPRLTRAARVAKRRRDVPPEQDAIAIDTLAGVFDLPSERPTRKRHRR